jgi:hypothetical protein
VVSATTTIPGVVDVAALLHVASGLPYTALGGADLNGDGIGDADRARRNPSDPSSTVSRNGERFPSWATLDLRVSRSFRTGGRGSVTVAIDAFNVFNRANFTDVNNVFGPGAYPGEPQVDARGRVVFGRFQKTHAPRQVQLGVRLSF